MAGKDAPAFALSDDAAVLSPPIGHDLVFTKDALVAGVHFFPHDPPALIARKALRVNLSDLAAMGAKPVGYLLALALPKEMPDRAKWVEKFASGLRRDQKEYDWQLFGGDTVVTEGPLTISITAIGSVVQGQALRRRGAQENDDIYVSGTLGDSALGLKCLTGDISPSDLGAVERDFLQNRYHLPHPRLELGQKLWGLASATLDISDGVAGDIRHICRLSGLGACLNENFMPLSDAAGKVLESFPVYKSLLWNGGDDYELLFTASAQKADDIQRLSQVLNLRLTKIGQMTARTEITILDRKGQNILANDQGFRHF